MLIILALKRLRQGLARWALSTLQEGALSEATGGCHTVIASS